MNGKDLTAQLHNAWMDVGTGKQSVKLKDAWTRYKQTRVQEHRGTETKEVSMQAAQDNLLFKELWSMECEPASQSE